MKEPNIGTMTPRQILAKRAFLRARPSGNLLYSGEIRREGTLDTQADTSDTVRYDVFTQADFMREFDVNAHKVNSLKYYPNTILKNVGGKTAAKIKTRVAIAFQERIWTKRMATLTGNNVNIRLSSSRRSPGDQQGLNDFREGWENKNIENCIFEAIGADGKTGDCAVCFYLKGGKMGWRVFSYENGDTLYPHYDPMTGRMSLFGRRYTVRDENGEDVAEYLDVYDDSHYMRYRRQKKGVKAVVSNVRGLLGLGDWEVDQEPVPHRFRRIPVAYDRYGAPFWANSQSLIENYELSMSQLAENNMAYALRILYALGGEVELTTTIDGTPTRIDSPDPNTKIGYLEPADSSRSYELQLNTLEKNIMRSSFAVETPEIKSGSDMSSLTVKMLFADSYQKALLDAQHFQPFLDDIVELFKYAYGIETGRSSDFEVLMVKAEIFPYVFMSETEQVNNIVQLRASGVLSRQSGAELAYELGYGINSENERIVGEERAELIAEGMSGAVGGSSSGNTVNEARNRMS